MSRLNFKPKQGAIADFNLEPILGSETGGKGRPCIVITNDFYNAKLSVIQIIPITAWSQKKGKIVTNVVLTPSTQNGLTKKSVADCLQTRPVDYTKRLIKPRGEVNQQTLDKLFRALTILFGLP